MEVLIYEDGDAWARARPEVEAEGEGWIDGSFCDWEVVAWELQDMYEMEGKDIVHVLYTGRMDIGLDEELELSNYTWGYALCHYY